MSISRNEIEERILQRIDTPGWVATRGLVSEPDDPTAQLEYGIIEDIMKSLGHRGMVQLWRITLLDGGQSYLAAARPGLKLDEDLQQRGAWATAEKYVLEE